MFGVLELCAQYKGLCQHMSISASVYAYFHIYPCGGMLAACVCTDISGLCHRVPELPVRGSAWLCVHGFVLVGASGSGWQTSAHAQQEGLCLCSHDVGAVPGQERQVYSARTQAAGACADHVYVQLRVLAAGRPDAQCIACFRRVSRFVPSPRAASWAPGSGGPGLGFSALSAWRPSGPLDSLPGGRSRIGSRYRLRRVGVEVGGGRGARPSIFCYYSVMGLLGRPPICHRPRSLITGICHHFPLRQCHQRC